MSPSAYLHAVRNLEAIPVVLHLDKETTAAYQNLAPEIKNYQSNRGDLYVKINKAVYGLSESALDWYKELSDTLIAAGFVRSDTDRCLFAKFEGTRNVVTVVTHVDDLIVSHSSALHRNQLLQTLEQLYGKLKVK